MCRGSDLQSENFFLAFFALIEIPQFLLAQNHARQARVGVRPSLFGVRFLFELLKTLVAAVWDLLFWVPFLVHTRFSEF